MGAPVTIASAGAEVRGRVREGGVRDGMGGGAPGAPVTNITVTAGRAKIVLGVLQNNAGIRVRIRQMAPDLTEVGCNLDEAKALRQEHDELVLKLNAKQRELAAVLADQETGAGGEEAGRRPLADMLTDAWKDISKQLECRKMLLDQSVAFHASALQLGKKMSQVEEKCKTTTIAHDVETARRLLQQHQELKKSVLEASMSTLQEGQMLLDRIRQMASCADVQNRHATTSACYGIEQLLLKLQDRKRRLEELWHIRRQQLSQCIRILEIEQQAVELGKWLDEEEAIVNKKELGESLETATTLRNEFLEKTNTSITTAKRDELQRLIGTTELIVGTALPQKAEVKQRLQALLARIDCVMGNAASRYINVTQAFGFYSAHDEGTGKLNDIEMLLSRTDRQGSELVQRHTQLYEAVAEASAEVIYLGQTLLQRNGKENPVVKDILAKLVAFQERCDKLYGQCTAFHEQGKQNDALHQLQCKLAKTASWLRKVGHSDDDSDIGKTKFASQRYPIRNKEFSAAIKEKQLEMKAMLATAETVAKKIQEKTTTQDGAAPKQNGVADGDQVAEEAKTTFGSSEVQKVAERVKEATDEIEAIVSANEKRAKLNRTLINYHIKNQQLFAVMSIVEELLRAERDPSHITEATVKHKEDVYKSLAPLVTDVERISKQFNTDVTEAKLESSQQAQLMEVQQILGYVTQRNQLLTQYYEHWKVFVATGRDFNDQWKQFVLEARKTIDWIMKVEHEFFPKLAGELGQSLDEVKKHEKRLDDFRPTIKKVQEEIEKHLKTAELVSLKGDTRGQRDQIINELLKVHTRFQARVGEYRFLINMASKFFENLQALDRLIETTEKEYKNEEMPKDVTVCQTVLQQHEQSRLKMKQLIDFSTDEADQIVTRVRQQDSESDAKDGVQKLLQMSEGKRREWETAWDDHKRRLEQNFLLSQFYFDLKKLQDELDELQRLLEARHGCYGSSLSSVIMTSKAFQLFEKAADLIEGKVKEFMRTADRMIHDRHYDSRRVRHEVDDTEKKWITFYNTIKSYRAALDDSLKFFEQMGTCEGWLNDAGQFLLGISRRAPAAKESGDVDGLIAEIEKYRLEGFNTQDGRLNGMERIASDLYGPVGGPEKMQNILDKNHEMYNAFVKAIEDLSILRSNLIKTEQILTTMEFVIEKKAPRPPRFVQPLNSAEMSEGQSFTFECRLECDATAPTIEWQKDGAPTKGFTASYKDGLCRLVISETMVEDSGTFLCKATTEAGTAETSATLKVKVAQPKVVAPDFAKHLRAADVPEGTSHTLECLVTGIPAPTVTWLFNDKPISNDNNYLITTESGGRCLLKIRKLTKELAGPYSCRVSNPGGEITSSAGINVVAVKKPEFIQPLTDAYIGEGQRIKLECKYIGEPAPQIQWLYNDQPIFPSGILKIIVEDGYTALDIQQVFAEDCGTYTAVAKNLGGEARTSCLLSTDLGAGRVGGRVPCPPEFTQPLQQHRDVQEGSRARLECVCTGCPEPEIEWYHNDKLVKKGGKDFELSYEAGRCALLIQEVYLEDSGDYVCVATNVHGTARTKCRVIVEPLSELSDASASASNEVPPKFTQLLKDIEGTEGELVCFECRVIGHPTPVIKWYRGRNQIQSTPEFLIKSERELQTLTIPKSCRDDAGNYMVKANNEAGVAKCYATLVIKPPGDHHGMKMRLVESSHSVQTGVLAEGHQPPAITRAFHDFTVRQGKPCSMEVVIVGRPQPTVQWLFNNEPVKAGVYQISSFGDTHILHIPEVYEEDAGRFSVVAENESGKAWCSALLVVVDESQLMPGEGSPPETPQGMFQPQTYGPPPVVPLKRPPRTVKAEPPKVADLPAVPPEFTQPLKNLTVDEGSRISFEGFVEGRPEPIVRWFKDGRPLIGTAADRYEIANLGGGRVRLSVATGKVSDAGRYTVMANNSGGEASSTAELIIKEVAVPPLFTERLQMVEVKEGEPVRFRVRVSGKPPPTVTWYRDGVQVVSSPDFNITQHGDIHSLYIPEVFYEDSGKFSVKAVSASGESQCTAELIVEAPLSSMDDYLTPSPPFSRSPSSDVTTSLFTKPLYNRAVQVGQRVTLECAIPPQPTPERVQWFHNEIEIHPSPTHQIAYSNGLCSLTISQAKPELRGRYVCAVVVRGLRGSTDMTLDVHGEPVQEISERRPEFVAKLQNVQSDFGHDALFSCHVTAQPPPNLQWLHNGRPIRPSKHYEMKYERDVGLCTLRIRDVQPEDAGSYTLTATNYSGQVSSSADLLLPVGGSGVDETSYVDSAALRRLTGGRGVRGGDRGLGGVSEQFFKPVFHKIPSDLEVTEGQMARFDSVVAGRPIPDMLWFRDGVQVFNDVLHKIVINEEGINSLIFDATTAADDGLYTCIAQNRAGEDRFQVRLNVNRRAATFVPRFVSHMANQTVSEGQSATFTAQYEGVPAPTISWQRDGSQIDGSSGRYRISTDTHTSTLFIPIVSPEDNTWFQCTASSAAGTATHRARLIVQVEPRERVVATQSPIMARRTPVQHTSPSPSRAARTTTPVGGRGGPSPGPYYSAQHQSNASMTVSQTPPQRGRSSPWQQQMERTDTVVRTVSGGMYAEMLSVAAPQLLEPMKDVQVNEGMTANFRCKIYSETEPQSEWFFNNRPFHASARHQISKTADGVYALSVSNIGVNDAGVYKCVVSNGGGEVTCIAHLRVGSSTPAMRAEHYGSSRDPFSSPGPRDHSYETTTRQQMTTTTTSRTTPLSQDNLAWQQQQQLEAGSIRMQAELAAAGGAGQDTTSPPRFVRLLTDLSITAGSPALFEVIVLADPRPTVTWYRDGQQIQHSRDFQILRDGDKYSLSVTEAVPEDTGLITCRAVNPAGMRESSARLVVQAAGIAPKFTRPLSSVTAVDGSEVTLSCVVIGRPAPEVTWYHDDVSLDKSKEFIIRYDQQTGLAELVIVDCMMDDRGQFKCVARNASGQAETSATLNVTPESKPARPAPQPQATTIQSDYTVSVQTTPSNSAPITGEIVSRHDQSTVLITSAEPVGDAPKFAQPIQPCVVVEGHNCTFSAIVGGDPFPEIAWLKEKQDLVLTDRHQTSVNVHTGACFLTILACQMSDTGVYSCRASNTAGRATCTANVVVVPPNVEVTVTEKTMSVKKEKVTTLGDQEMRVVENSPTFTEALQPIIEVNDGEPVRFQCQVSAEPPARTTWYFGASELSGSGGRMNISSGGAGVTSLSIAAVTLADTGEYQCRASNSLGEAVTKSFLRVVKKGDKETATSGTVPSHVAVDGSNQSSQPSQPIGQVLSAGSAIEVSLGPSSLTQPYSLVMAGDVRPSSPKFTVPLRNQAANDHESVWFTVEFTGFPTPVLTWYINGRPVLIDDSGEFQIRTNVERGVSKLFVRQVLAEEDEGEFTCKAENSIGTAITNAHLFIAQPSTLTTRPNTGLTTVDISSKMTSYDLISDHVMSRDLISDRMIEDHVTKKSLVSTLHANILDEFRAAHVDSVFVPIHVYEGRDFELESIERSLAGNKVTSHTLTTPAPARCFSETVAIDANKEEKEQTFEFRLLAERKKVKVSQLHAYQVALPRGVRMEAEIVDEAEPHKTSSMDLKRSNYADAIASQRRELYLEIGGKPPRFVADLSHKKVMDGSSIKLACKVTGDPMPEKVLWYHNQKPVPSTSPDMETAYDIKTGEAVLAIAEVFPQDDGVYECTASNVYGRATTRCQLEVEAYEYVPDSEESYTSQAESNLSVTSSTKQAPISPDITPKVAPPLTARRQEFEESCLIASVKHLNKVETNQLPEIPHGETMLSDLPRVPTPVESQVAKVDDFTENRVISDIPASWSFVQSKLDTGAESVSQLQREKESSPEVAVEREVIVNLTNASKLSKKQTLVGVQEEFHSEGEEEDLFYDAVEPSLNSKTVSVDTSAAVLSAAKLRPFSQTLPLVAHISPETTGAGLQELRGEIPVERQVPSAFVAVTKKPPTPAHTITQTETSLIIAVVEEFTNPSNFEPAPTPSITAPELISSAENRRAASWSLQQYAAPADESGHVIDEVLRPQGPVALRSSLIEPVTAEPVASSTVSLVKTIEERTTTESVGTPELDIYTSAVRLNVDHIETPELDRTRIVTKPATRVEESRTSPAIICSTDVTRTGVDDLVLVLPPPTCIDIELSSHVTDLQPITRAAVMDGSVMADTAAETRSPRIDDLAVMLTPTDPSLAALTVPTTETRPVQRTRVIEANFTDIEARTGVDDLDLVLVLPPPTCIDIELSSHITDLQPITRAAVIDGSVMADTAAETQSPRTDDLAVTLTPSDPSLAALTVPTTETRPVQRTRVIEANFTDIETAEPKSPMNLDKLLLNLPADQKTYTIELSTSKTVDKPLMRVKVIEEDAAAHDVSAVEAEPSGDALSVKLPPPDVVGSEFGSSTNEGRPVTRAITNEDRLSPEKILEGVVADQTDHFAVTLSPEQIISDSLAKAARTNGVPCSMVRATVERTSPERVGEEALKTDDIAMKLSEPEHINSECCDEKLSGSKSVTRVDTLTAWAKLEEGTQSDQSTAAEQRLSPVDQSEQGDLGHANISDLIIFSRQEVSEEQDVITESVYEEFEVVIPAEDVKAAATEITVEKEILTESVYEELQVVECPPTLQVVEPSCDIKTAAAEITVEKEILTESTYEEREVVKHPPTAIDETLARAEITEEKETTTESTYEEIHVIQDEIDSSFTHPDQLEPFLEVTCPQAVESEALRSNPAHLEISEEKEITTESTFEEWEVVDKLEEKIFREVVTPAKAKAELQRDDTLTADEGLYEEGVIMVSGTVDLNKDEEKETFDEGMYEERVIVVSEQLENKLEEKETFDEGLFEEGVIMVSAKADKKAEDAETKEEGMFEEWEVVVKRENEQRTDQQLVVPRQKSTESEESFFSEGEIVEKITTFETTIVSEKADESARDRHDVTALVITGEANREEEQRSRGSSVGLDLGTKSPRSDSDNESFFSETEILERFMTTETTVETTTTKKTSWPVTSSTTTTENVSRLAMTQRSDVTKQEIYTDVIGTGLTRSILPPPHESITYGVTDIVGERARCILGDENAIKTVCGSGIKDGENQHGGRQVDKSPDGSRAEIEETRMELTHSVGQGRAPISALRGQRSDAVVAQGKDAIGAVISRDALALVQPAPPRLVRALTPATISAGVTSSISCQVTGNPRPIVKWFLDGIEIKESKDFRMTCNEEGVYCLTISNVLPEDEGEYCARAINETGATATSAYITVQHEEGVSPARTRKNVTEGTQSVKKGVPLSKSLALDKERPGGDDVVYSSGEETTTSWTVEQQQQLQQQPQQKQPKRQLFEQHGQTSLPHTSQRTASDTWQQDQSSFTMMPRRLMISRREEMRPILQTLSGKEVVPFDGMGEAPSFINKLESRDAFESTPVKLECDVTGHPRPEIAWFQPNYSPVDDAMLVMISDEFHVQCEFDTLMDGVPISDNNDHVRLDYEEDGHCRLYIDRVRIEDEAEYACQAKNEHGVATTWAELFVEKLIEGMERLVIEEYHELEVEMQFKWKQPKGDINKEREATI